jgi:ribonuclease J
MVVHTGDFKIDTTPDFISMIDLARFGELGKNGVLALCPTRRTWKNRVTASRKAAWEKALTIFSRAAPSGSLCTTFFSNVHRIQQVIDWRHPVQAESRYYGAQHGEHPARRHWNWAI